MRLPYGHTSVEQRKLWMPLRGLKPTSIDRPLLKKLASLVGAATEAAAMIGKMVYEKSYYGPEDRKPNSRQAFIPKSPRRGRGIGPYNFPGHLRGL